MADDNQRDDSTDRTLERPSVVESMEEVVSASNSSSPLSSCAIGDGDIDKITSCTSCDESDNEDGSSAHYIFCDDEQDNRDSNNNQLIASNGHDLSKNHRRDDGEKQAHATRSRLPGKCKQFDYASEVCSDINNNNDCGFLQSNKNSNHQDHPKNRRIIASQQGLRRRRRGQNSSKFTEAQCNELPESSSSGLLLNLYLSLRNVAVQYLNYTQKANHIDEKMPSSSGYQPLPGRDTFSRPPPRKLSYKRSQRLGGSDGYSRLNHNYHKPQPQTTFCQE